MSASLISHGVRVSFSANSSAALVCAPNSALFGSFSAFQSSSVSPARFDEARWCCSQ